MQDYYRPVYHFTPRQGWMNDPNGLIRFRGTYHAFYQHNPYAPKWGPMHWGHAVSRDLVHWEHLPLALRPDHDYETGCFSGSAVDNDGELALLYTAHHDGRSPRETQCLALSRDGLYFDKYEKNPVICGAPAGYSEDFRDPKVFRRGDTWYAVIGCARENRGGVLLYKSKDLRQWDLAGPLCESSGDQGIMWECPNFFEIDGAWVLLVSPIGMEKTRTMFITGEADFEKPAFVQKRWRRADYGYDFYAPQVFIGEGGRHILFGWMDLWKGDFSAFTDGWAGAFTFPRELFLKDGAVCQRPVEELALLRKKELFSGPLRLLPDQRNNLSGVKGDCLEMAFTIPETRVPLTMHLRTAAGGEEKIILQWDPPSRTFTLDNGNGGGRPEKIAIPLGEDGENDIDLRILIDRSSLELFFCGGKYSAASWIFPRPSSLFYDIFTGGREIFIPDMKIFVLG